MPITPMTRMALISGTTSVSGTTPITSITTITRIASIVRSMTSSSMTGTTPSTLLRVRAHQFLVIATLAIVIRTVISTFTSPSPVVSAQGNCANVVIRAPYPNEVLTEDRVTVLGSAQIDGFNFYKVEWSDASAPDVWSSVSDTHSQTVVNGLLDQWEVGRLPDGTYALKLTAVNQFSEEVCRAVVPGLWIARAGTPTPTETATTTPTATPEAATATAVSAATGVAGTSEPGTPEPGTPGAAGAEAGSGTPGADATLPAAELRAAGDSGSASSIAAQATSSLSEAFSYFVYGFAGALGLALAIWFLTALRRGA